MICKVCSRPITEWAGRGRPPEFHNWCHPRGLKRNKSARNVATGDEPSAQAQYRARKAEGMERAAIADPISRARELAVMLSLEPDPARAAQLLGWTLTPEELAIVAEDANREEYEALREGHRQATSKAIRAIISLCAERLLRSIHTLQPSQLPLTIRWLTAVNEALGTGDRAFAHAQVVFQAPTNEEPEQPILHA